MNRKELVKTLELVEPALSDNNLVPVFTCFMFKEKSIEAYNDNLGIVAKNTFGTEQFAKNSQFAVGGKTLLGLLQNNHADEVDFQVTDENVIMKAGKSVVKLPYFPEKEFLFEEPNEKWAASMAINDHLLMGIETCLNTACTDLTKPAFLGVCFNIDHDPDHPLELFSTDGDAITRYTVNTTGKGKGVFTVPNAFCSALIKIATETDVREGKLQLSGNWARATLANGFVVYGRIIINEKPLDHQLVIDQSLKGKQPFVPLPLGLNDALARARVLADPESSKTVMTVEGGKLRLVTTTHMGDLKDELNIRGHGDVEATVHASLVQRSLNVCDQISIRENVTAYKLGVTVLQVVANIGG